MTPSPTRLLLALACCAAALPASAITVTVTRVEIRGLEDEAMRDNVRSALSLQDEVGRDLGARRLNYLLRIADEEAREALQPFGYYSPVITIQRSDRDTPVGTPRRDDDASRAGTARDNAGNDAGATEASAPRNGNGARRDRELQVVITIEPGQPVRVRGYRIAVEVLGGTSILGGRGSYLGTVAGVILITLLQSILSVMQMPEAGRQITYGIVIVIMLLLYGRAPATR